MRRLTPTWRAITAALQELEATLPLSKALTEIDQALSERSLSQRIYTHLNGAQTASVKIIPFEPRYGPAFKRLNLEWLKKYFTVEPIDEAMLS